jgi:hypothetical protein
VKVHTKLIQNSSGMKRSFPLGFDKINDGSEIINRIYYGGDFDLFVSLILKYGRLSYPPPSFYYDKLFYYLKYKIHAILSFTSLDVLTCLPQKSNTSIIKNYFGKTRICPTLLVKCLMLAYQRNDDETFKFLFDRGEGKYLVRLLELCNRYQYENLAKQVLESRNRLRGVRGGYLR